MREVSRRELPSFTAAVYGHLSSTASRSLLSRASSPRRPVSHPRVNVYLCIKQALFIRPMNMHCFVAVARCRVQTRRYHCLINHIQSQRPTLCTPFIVLGASPRSPFPALITPHARTRRVIPRSFPRVSSHRVLPDASPGPRPLTVRPLPSPHQPAAIDTNLRNFFGPSTCHRVTAHPRPDVPDVCEVYEEIRFANADEAASNH